MTSNPVRNIRWEGKIAVVEVEGDIDLHQSTRFQKQLLSVLDDKPERIVVDLTNVPYMDSSGVASLVKLLSRTRERSIALKLAAPSRKVTSILEITSLDTVFDMEPSVEDALQ